MIGDDEPLTPDRQPCRVTLLTPAGRGAIAVIAVYGQHAVSRVSRSFQPAAGKPLEQLPPGRILFGRWAGGPNQPAEEVVVHQRDSENLEVHCHGGSAAADAIVQSLVRDGCVAADAATWARCLGPDSIAAQARIALAAALTSRTAAILLDQLRGSLRATLIQISGQLLAGNTPAARNELASLQQLAGVGLHLTQPWRVVIAGDTNVGKSSLVNAILGYQRSIIHPRPGVTRDIVTAETALDGWPVQLADTAGLRASDDPIELAGVQRARREIAEADLVVLAFDASRPSSDDDEQRLAEAPDSLLVQNKCDLPIGQPLRAGALHTSAVTGQGIPALISGIVQRLAPSPPPPEAPVPFTQEQVDLVRAALNAVDRGRPSEAAAHIAQLLR